MALGRFLLMVIVTLGVSIAVSQNVYAQVDNENSETLDGPQVSLSGDLANNPVAQDILKKIEQTKKWIEDLEKRNYEELKKKEELDEKRRIALQSLSQDLEEWERLWEYYSPKNSFGRFVDKIPDPQVKEVFWDQFEFKEQKVKAGREAMKQVFANGGSLQQARLAYHTAAETKRIELIEANAQFNVKRQLAYYEQQILFDKEGQFINSTITGEKLRKYFEDYRTNPAYLEANPDDVTSWEEFGQTNADTQCREGYIVIYRFHANDYVCVTKETAEFWIRHGMGEILGQSNEESSSIVEQKVDPLTRCEEGMTVILNKEKNMYSCVFEETAQEWVDQGIAEYPDVEDFIRKSIEKKESFLLIDEINHQIRQIELQLEDEKSLLDEEYEKKFEALYVKSKEYERQITNDYNENSKMSKDELSQKIISLREQYEDDWEELESGKKNEKRDMERKFERMIENLVEEYDDEPLIKIVNKGGISYRAEPIEGQ